ncbi:MAG: LacI family DNA-binding transcriptional regulator [Chthonomonadales bacterium]|nr:LacI family DNA-binding transcriptional regulator [Chthonomonadales bacterium]
MVTLQDVARLAGVSCATASRALAGSPLVRPATRERVRCVAAQAGYHVNRVARSLATRATCTLGLVVPEVINPYYPKLIHLSVQEARRAGYSVLLTISGSHQEDEGECVRSLYERRADGIIVVTGTGGLTARPEVERLHERGVPVVLLGWVAGAERFSMVTGDDAAGARALTRHLLAAGRRRIVLVGGTAVRGPFDRIRGFLEAIREAGLPEEGSLCPAVDGDRALADTLSGLMARAEPPDALFAYNDTLAAGVLRELEAMGIAVPDRVAVVGFDNLDLAEVVRPRLTTVDYPIEAFAEQAVRMVLERLQDGCQPPRRVIVTPHIVVRQSCGGGRPAAR